MHHAPLPRFASASTEELRRLGEDDLVPAVDFNVITLATVPWILAEGADD